MSRRHRQIAPLQEQASREVSIRVNVEPVASPAAGCSSPQAIALPRWSIEATPQVAVCNLLFRLSQTNRVRTLSQRPVHSVRVCLSRLCWVDFLHDYDLELQSSDLRDAFGKPE